MLRRGVPDSLRCAIWTSNVVQITHPHQSPRDWHEYRTLAKARALDEAYESLLESILAVVGPSPPPGAAGASSGDKDAATPPPARPSMPTPEGEAVLESIPTPTFGHAALARDPDQFIRQCFPEASAKGLASWKRVMLALDAVLSTGGGGMGAQGGGGGGDNDAGPDAVPVLTALLLTCAPESYAFCAVREMAVHGRDHYLPATRRQARAVERAFCDVLRKLHSSTHEYLDDRGALDDLSPLFRDMFVPLLPLQYAKWILDVYTLEGIKVIFRFGVAVLVLYKVYAHENLLTISRADEWWNGLRHWAHSRHFDFELVVRKAYGVHGRGLRRQMRFPRRHILQRIIRIEEDRLLEREQEEEEEEGIGAGDHGAGRGGAAATSSLGAAAVRPLGLVRPDLSGLREVCVAGGSSHHSGGSNSSSASALSKRDLIAQPILAEPLAVRLNLARWLPLRLQMSNLELLYSTSYHGRSLDMLYRRVRNYRHTVLLCEVLPRRSAASALAAATRTPTPGQEQPAGHQDAGKETGCSTSGPVVIGMYAPQVWRASAQVYGDASCLLFRASPDPRGWGWRPTRPQNGESVLDTVDDSWESSDEAFRRNNEIALLEQFMVGTKTYISMGGNRDGSAGLRLNEDLTIGESSPAAGFGNEPLPGSEYGKSSIFDVGLVEVYGLVRQIDGRPA
jgi:hypothetical protein